jgi:hypothetical protein
MKRNFATPLLALLSFGLLAASLVPAAQAANCSLETTAGDYGFTLTGTLFLPVGPLPITAIGRFRATIEGTVSGTEARNVAGSFVNETLSATFTVNPDCTGTATLMAFESGQLVRTVALSLVWDDNSNELRQVSESVTLPDGTNVPAVLTVEARKIRPNGSD